MAKIITFGELMLRLQPYNYERFVQCDHVEFTFGGGEANVAVSLANYGMDVAYVTKLPAHAIGQAAVNSLRRYGVDTSKASPHNCVCGHTFLQHQAISEAASVHDSHGVPRCRIKRWPLPTQRPSPRKKFFLFFHCLLDRGHITTPTKRFLE